MTVGERIKRARKGKFTQAELAELMGVHETTIRRWESGRDDGPTGKSLSKLATILNTTIAYLTGETDDPKRFHTLLDEYPDAPADIAPSPTMPLGRLEPPPGLGYWGEVVENARKAAALGKDIDLIAPMLQEALNVIEAARLATKQANASPAPAGAISA